MNSLFKKLYCIFTENQPKAENNNQSIISKNTSEDFMTSSLPSNNGLFELIECVNQEKISNSFKIDKISFTKKNYIQNCCNVKTKREDNCDEAENSVMKKKEINNLKYHKNCSTVSPKSVSNVGVLISDQKVNCKLRQPKGFLQNSKKIINLPVDMLRDTVSIANQSNTEKEIINLEKDKIDMQQNFINVDDNLKIIEKLGSDAIFCEKSNSESTTSKKLLCPELFNYFTSEENYKSISKDYENRQNLNAESMGDFNSIKNSICYPGTHEIYGEGGFLSKQENKINVENQKKQNGTFKEKSGQSTLIRDDFRNYDWHKDLSNGHNCTNTDFSLKRDNISSANGCRESFLESALLQDSEDIVAESIEDQKHVRNCAKISHKLPEFKLNQNYLKSRSLSEGSGSAGYIATRSESDLFGEEAKRKIYELSAKQTEVNHLQKGSKRKFLASPKEDKVKRLFHILEPRYKLFDDGSQNECMTPIEKSAINQVNNPKFNASENHNFSHRKEIDKVTEEKPQRKAKLEAIRKIKERVRG